VPEWRDERRVVSAATIPAAHQRAPLRPAAVYLLTAVVGVVAFAWPFWLTNASLAGTDHSGDAWLWASLLGLIVVGAVLLEVVEGTMNGATIAVLGVLASMNGLLRLLDLPGGGNAMFFLTILAAAVLGPRRGLLLGLTAMAASAVITAGIGPWLPYQMLGLGAIGAAAGGMGIVIERATLRTQVLVLAVFGWCASFGYGALMNLWTWPLIRDGGALSYAPGLGFFGTLHRYYSFYMATSFAWDAAGALANAVLLVLVGAPILRCLRRIRHRVSPSTVWA
jgi:energy-coupling factor transport system substrate-specific component